MRKINIIEPKVPQMPAPQKVAAYARVSMESERLQHSLSAQVSYRMTTTFASAEAPNGVPTFALAR